MAAGTSAVTLEVTATLPASVSFSANGEDTRWVAPGPTAALGGRQLTLLPLSQPWVFNTN